ncbi:MAG TPA: OmpA family protein [Gammaproteobacteria bacterium]|nr:OmpA family protein [Gammaproteobacteria bacterium]
MGAKTRLILCASGLAAFAACSHLPDRVDTLEQARTSVRTVEQDPLAAETASTEIQSAHAALDDADQAYRDHESLELITHKAYMAQRYADIAKERIAEGRAKKEIADAEALRNKVLLEARTREAQKATQDAQTAQRQAEQASQQAEQATQQAQEAHERNQDLEQELARLEPKETERGLVLTLGDVLFDTGQNSLKPGAGRTIDQLATFMSDHMDRKVLIEGHTDARGADDYNVQLSERRANAVREALVARGISADRIRTVGLGESYPIAGNDTTAGMQANRRVEIVISDEQGKFPGAAERSAAVR